LPHTRHLPLQAHPSSVRLARSWVRELLVDLGRGDLVPSAMLGVSELVTNAIIHGQAPISVTVTGDTDRPRVEVHDGGQPSWRPMTIEAVQGTVGPTTVGRGLTLVAVSSRRWGTRAGTSAAGEHTIVWFEPAAELRDRVDLSPVLDNPEPDEAIDPESDRHATIPIFLANLPVRLYAETRRHQYELRRELELLLFEHPGRFPTAAATITAIDNTIALRRPNSGFLEVDDAALEGRTTIDVTCSMRRSAPRVLADLRDALDACYAELSTDLLLTPGPAPEVRHFQEWFFGEVIGQAAGAAPTPWHGPLALVSNAPSTPD